MATGGGSFISKPARGWLHPDHLVSKEGIMYAVRVSFCALHLCFCLQNKYTYNAYGFFSTLAV